MLRLIAAMCLGVTPALAQDFSANSQAQSWGLAAEVPARFEAKVVDVLCTITGDCAEACGGGKRQLGLLRAADDALIFPNKNGQAFTGAVVDLLPYCGQMVEVDGLMIEDPDIGAHNIYLAQKVRALDDPAWKATTAWTAEWARKYPGAGAPAQWFRNDPRIKAMIAESGYLGLGLEPDAAFIAEEFK